MGSDLVTKWRALKAKWLREDLGIVENIPIKVEDKPIEPEDKPTKKDA
jgi:hypothetical protein